MINRVVLVGRLTKDVEVKKTQTDLSVASFTLACERKGKDAGADFINCVLWRQPADFLGQYGKKGAVVALDGRIQTRNFEDKDGKRVYVTEVVGENIRLLNGNANHGEAPVQDIPHEEPELDITSDELPF